MSQRRPSSGSALALTALRDESGQREGIVPDQPNPKESTKMNTDNVIDTTATVLTGPAKPKQPRKRSRQTPEQRNAVAKVVKPGEASSKRKAGEAKAKVAANAEKVAKINAEQDAAAKALADARAAVAAAKTVTGKATLSPAATRVERVKLAKAEAKTVKEWVAAGSVGERPATPNLDAIEAGEKVAAPVVAGSTSTRGPRSEHGRLAAAEKKRTNDKRGKGVKLTDDELVAYIAGILAENPRADRSEERQFAYWIGTGTAAAPAGIALSGNDRWNAAWKTATAQVRVAK